MKNICIFIFNALIIKYMKKILWIASYPKSGNTYMRALLSSLFYTNSGEFNFDILQRIKQFDSNKYYQFVQKINQYDYSNLIDIKVVSKYWELAQKKFNEVGDDFIFKTHAANLMWKNYKYTDENRTLGVIYLVRDPRDIAVSYAHHFDQDIDTIINQMVRIDAITQNPGKTIGIPLSSWNVHIKSWEMLNVPKFFIRYEDLIKEPKKIFSDIVAFLKNDLKINFDISKQKFDAIIKNTKFKALKKMEKEEGFPEQIPTRTFFRKGIYEAGKELGDIRVNRIITSFENAMKKFNYI